MPISAGIPAPDFSLPDETGQIHQLSAYRGKPVVLYFYPKDDTAGCTTEACGFRDDYSAYEQGGVVILGVSPDPPEKHARFKAKHSLPFTLLADDSHQVSTLYGVWGPKKFMGRTYEGVLRTTFLINSAGVIERVFENVKPANHSAEILATLQTGG